MKLTDKQRAAVLLIADRGVVYRGGRGDWGPAGEISSWTMSSLVSRRLVVLLGGGGHTERCPRSGVDVYTHRSPTDAKLTEAGQAAAAELRR